MASGGGFSFGNTSGLGKNTTGIGATGGISFGATAQPATTSGFGFNLGGTTTTQPGAASSGLTLGAAKTTGTLTLGATTTPATGFSFGTLSTTTTSTGLTLGAVKTTASTGLTLGATTTSSAATTGFGFGSLTKTTASGLGGGLGGFGTSTTSTAPVTTASVGLGGVDPKNSASGAGVAGTGGKPSDSKAVKECALPKEICVTVEDFKKFAKNQKSVRENIARMSSKPLYRVQEEMASLKQLLSLVSTGLQRNAVAIDKLKKETAQEIKHAEMAQRTKDTPPGLQYENVAPTEYFHVLAEKFESQMVVYRQQIEETEGHLASMHHADALSPQELASLLNKLHDSFVVLAAQLQAVHEAVKAQKEQYLNYRKVFLGDSANIFEKRKKVEEKTGARVAVTVGPTPFTDMSNATALAMASALTRTQQPPGASAVQPGTGIFGGQPTAGGTGLFGANTGSTATGAGLFGANTSATTGGLFGSKPTGFGSTGFGTAGVTTTSGFSFTTPTATVRPLGTFGSTVATGTGFSTPQPPAGGGFSFGQTNTAFQLQNPPAGIKRGKKA